MQVSGNQNTWKENGNRIKQKKKNLRPSSRHYLIRGILNSRVTVSGANLCQKEGGKMKKSENNMNAQDNEY